MSGPVHCMWEQSGADQDVDHIKSGPVRAPSDVISSRINPRIEKNLPIIGVNLCQ